MQFTGKCDPDQIIGLNTFHPRDFHAIQAKQRERFNRIVAQHRLVNLAGQVAQGLITHIDQVRVLRQLQCQVGRFAGATSQIHHRLQRSAVGEGHNGLRQGTDEHRDLVGGHLCDLRLFSSRQAQLRVAHQQASDFVLKHETEQQRRQDSQDHALAQRQLAQMFSQGPQRILSEHHAFSDGPLAGTTAEGLS